MKELLEYLFLDDWSKIKRRDKRMIKFGAFLWVLLFFYLGWVA